MSNIGWRSFTVWARNRDVFFFTWKTNFLPPFLEPILYLLVMGFAFTTLIPHLPPPYENISYQKFLGPGLIAISIMYGAFYECTYGSFVRMHYQKTFEAIVATPVSIEEVIAGEIFWGATKSLINSTIVLGVVVVAGLATFPGFILVPTIGLLGGLAFASMAMIFTALVPNLDSFNFPFFLFITPMFLVSGTFFPISVLPGALQDVALVFPLTHVSTVVRDLSLGLYSTDILYSLLYLLVLTLVTFYLAVFLMKWRLVK
jgi:lipooligosaccharide transport system permease protein